MTRTEHEAFGPWREGAHDNLALAVRSPPEPASAAGDGIRAAGGPHGHPVRQVMGQQEAGCEAAHRQRQGRRQARQAQELGYKLEPADPPHPGG